ncbi:hypothetical protein HX005_11030 [Acinetobacter sp. R933-2]|uniref:hypothetical protein n=1 Tax=Acinetobacter sp. R933-2 TaxID=2746728 RepID=UPI0025777CB1|nr:hypothetical protein [Acinetobacter sp. R933-2]MDM1247922.1 hypothetical protein [Acinetobacter sp. R933-2]
MSNKVVECVACGHVGATGKKGSTTIFIVLLLVMFPLGIIYWMLNRGGGVCSACKSSNIRLYVPKKQIQQSAQSISNNVQQIQCPDCCEYIRYDARKCKHCGSMIGG